MPIAKLKELGLSAERHSLYEDLISSLNQCEDEEGLQQWEADYKSDIIALEEGDIGRIASIADLVKEEVKDRRKFLKMKKEFSYA